VFRNAGVCMRLSRLVPFLILFLGFQNIPACGQVVATWTDSSGNWSNGANWSTNPVVPNNGGGTFYDVVINGTGSDTIAFDASGTVISSLMLGAGETLQGNGLSSFLTISPSSAGVVAITCSGTINALNVVLNGGGAVETTGAGEVGAFVNSSLIATSGTSVSRDVGFDNSILNVQGNLASGGGQLTLQDGSVGTVTGTLSLSFGNIVVNNSTLNVQGDYGVGGSAFSSLNTGVLNVGGNLTIGNSSLFMGGSSAFVGGNLTNADGLVQISGGSLVVLGTYANSLSETTIGNGASLFVRGDFNNASGEGPANVSLSGGSSVIVSGNFNNVMTGGVVTLDGSTLTVNGNFTNLAGISGSKNVSLENGGVLNVGGTFTNGVTAFNPNSLQLLGAGNTANLHAVQNNGLVHVDSGSNVNVTGSGFSNNTGGTLNLSGTLNVNGGFTNSGGSVILNPRASLTTGSYSQGGGLTDVSGNLTSRSYSQTGGNTIVESGGKLTATTFTATGGTVTVNGNLDPTAVEFGSGATLNGTGIMVGNVAMGGTIAPGSPGTPGILTIHGNYELLSNGMLQELIGPLSHAFVNVTGDVALDSNSFLDIILLNGYDPLGQTFAIMDYSSLVGQFGNGSSFSEDGFLWDISYGQNQIDITAVQAPEPRTLPLIGVGLVFLGFCVSRRRFHWLGVRAHHRR